MKYIKGLDTLRAFAVFFVLIEHKGVWFDDSVLNGRFIKQVLIPDGGFGVVLFFVLSGFLITTILLNQRYADKTNTGRFATLKGFYIRRALRIFPIYYLLLLFLYLINYPDIRNYLPYHISYTTNILCYRTNQWNSFSHVWTLCVEEQFYLIWPWLIMFVREKYLKHLLISAILIGVVSTWYCVHVAEHIAPLLVFNCFDAFGIGGLLAYALLNEEVNKRFQRLLPRFAITALFFHFVLRMLFFLHYPIYGGEFTMAIQSVISVWIINLVVKAKPSRFRRYFLENRFLTFVGKISYGIYLYHYVYNVLVYDQLNDYLSRITVHYPAAHDLVTDHHFYYWLHVALIIAFSAMSYYIIEKPFLNLKNFFGYNRQPVVSPPTS